MMSISPPPPPRGHGVAIRAPGPAKPPAPSAAPHADAFADTLERLTARRLKPRDPGAPEAATAPAATPTTRPLIPETEPEPEPGQAITPAPERQGMLSRATMAAGIDPADARAMEAALRETARVGAAAPDLHVTVATTPGDLVATVAVAVAPDGRLNILIAGTGAAAAGYLARGLADLRRRLAAAGLDAASVEIAGTPASPRERQIARRPLARQG